eukprot:660788-Rhodomonas_salina.2
MCFNQHRLVHDPPANSSIASVVLQDDPSGGQAGIVAPTVSPHRCLSGHCARVVTLTSYHGLAATPPPGHGEGGSLT